MTRAPSPGRGAGAGPCPPLWRPGGAPPQLPPACPRPAWGVRLARPACPLPRPSVSFIFSSPPLWGLQGCCPAPRAGPGRSCPPRRAPRLPSSLGGRQRGGPGPARPAAAFCPVFPGKRDEAGLAARLLGLLRCSLGHTRRLLRGRSEGVRERWGGGGGVPPRRWRKRGGSAHALGVAA